MRSSKGSALYLTYPTETQLINVNNYFEEYKECMLDMVEMIDKLITKNKKWEAEFYEGVLGLSSNEIEELEEITSIDKLTCQGEISPINHALEESDADFQMKYEMALSKVENHDLVSLKERMEVEGDIYSHYNLKYGHYKWVYGEEYPSIDQDLNPYNFSNIVFCVKVYHPYVSFANQGFKIKLLHEIHILGSQYLSDLKDAIVCNMDYSGIADMSNLTSSKRRPEEFKKRENYKSSFIFIENQFFNDTRNENVKDISKTIIDWLNKKRVKPFLSGSMENTRMLDLKLKLGRPYVYQHQGDCEHILIVSDIRFLQIDDPLKTQNFPRLYANGRCSGRYCMMCGVSYAKWLVTENPRLAHDKTYFCSACLMSYNYIEGRKVGNFKLFEYIDPLALI